MIYEIIDKKEYSPDEGTLNRKYIKLTLKDGRDAVFEIDVLRDDFEDDEKVMDQIFKIRNPKTEEKVKTYDIREIPNETIPRSIDLNR